MMKKLRQYIGLLLLLFLAGCSAQDFPGCCDPTGDRDVSFTETFLFNFKTGVGNISKGNPAGNLQIVSNADLSTLLSAAQDQQLLGQNLGMVSGVVLFNGAPVKDVALKVTDSTTGNIIAIRVEGEIEQSGGTELLRLPDGTICPGTPASDPKDPLNGFLSFDAAGNISSNLCVSTTARGQGSIYYNSPGGIPDFSNNKGTSEAGSFSIFNVPAGDIHLWASRAARGSTRITVFSEKISVGNIPVFPIPVATTDVDGNAVDISLGEGNNRVFDATMSILGSSPLMTASSGADGNYVFNSIGANSHFMMKSEKSGFWTTYQNLNTAPFQGQANIPTVNLDAKFYPNTYLDGIAAGVGISSIDTSKGIIAGRVQKGDGTPQHCAQLSITNGAGVNLLNTPGVKIAYPDMGGAAGTDRPDCTRKDPNNSSAPDPNQTSLSGQFIIFNLPPGEVFIRFQAKLKPEPSVTLISGGAIASAFSGVVFDLDLFNSGNGTSQALSGLVNDEGNSPSPDVDIDILGIDQRTYNGTFDLTSVKSSPSGDYSIPQNTTKEDPPYPLVAGTPYRLKTSKTGSADTYQDVMILNSATRQDLVISGSTPPIAGEGEIHGILINQSNGRLAKDVTLKITDLSGTSVGGGTITSATGMFTISNLSPGLVNIKVISGDDSGNMVARVYDQGVSFVKFPMVKVIPAEVTAKGSLKDLSGATVTSPLKILGRPGTLLSSDLADPAKGIPLDTNSRFVIRATNAGFDTYNYFPKTSIVDLNGLDLFSISRSEITGIAGGTAPSAANGIILGKTVENRFDLLPPSTNCNPATAHGLTAGFFDQDTNLDIAISNCTGAAPTDRVSIFFGDGNGGFSTPAGQDIISVGNNPVAIGQGDFDGDGSSDMAVVHQGDDPNTETGISILLGDPNGQFTKVPNPLVDSNENALPIIANPSATPPVTGVSSPVKNPVALAVGLFDSDTNLDIAVVNNSTTPAPSVFILLGNGDGTFRPNVDPTTGALISNPITGTPTAILAHNFNKDIQNQLDLVIASSNGSVLALHGNTADGTFTQPNPTSCITNPVQVKNSAGTIVPPRAMVTVDLNSDNVHDLAVVSGNTLAIFTGNASGTFDPLEDLTGGPLIDPLTGNPLLDACENQIFPIATPLSFGTDLTDITFGEFNGDNRVDLAVSDKGSGANDQVFVLFGIGDGSFSAPIPLLSTAPAPGIIPDRIMSVNMDNNELIDLILVGSRLGSLLGDEKPVGGIAVEARNMAGLTTGGTTRYLDCNGIVDSNLSATVSNCPSPDQDGRFAILDVPPGLAAVRAKNKNDFGGTTCPAPVKCAAGNSIINTFADSVSYTTVRTTALDPIEVTVDGVTFDPVGPPPAGRPVGTVRIDVLGINPPNPPVESASGLGTEGDYTLTLDANSEYILKLSFQGP
ncbi:MAG: FG-GAP repeat domain-containing protein [Nitrospiria bacterium]